MSAPDWGATPRVIHQRFGGGTLRHLHGDDCAGLPASLAGYTRLVAPRASLWWIVATCAMRLLRGRKGMGR